MLSPSNANARKRLVHFRETIYKAARSICGKKIRLQQIGLSLTLKKYIPSLRKKRHLGCIDRPSENNLQVLRMPAAQRSVWRRASDYWLQQFYRWRQIQNAAYTGNIKAEVCVDHPNPKTGDQTRDLNRY